MRICDGCEKPLEEYSDVEIMVDDIPDHSMELCSDCVARAMDTIRDSLRKEFLKEEKKMTEETKEEDTSPSDGYHTMAELYRHRFFLFIALCQQMSNIAWRANNHDDGTCYEGHFIAGIDLPAGTISYHLPNKYWVFLDNSGIRTTNKAPKWDGHTSEDVLTRLKECIIDGGDRHE